MATTAKTSPKQWILAVLKFTPLFQLLAIFKELNSEGAYLSLQKEKENRCLVSTCPPREIRKFHVGIVQWWQRNVQKNVMHVQLKLLFVNLNLLLFLPFQLLLTLLLLRVLSGMAYGAQMWNHSPLACVQASFIPYVPRWRKKKQGDVYT